MVLFRRGDAKKSCIREIDDKGEFPFREGKHHEMFLLKRIAGPFFQDVSYRWRDCRNLTASSHFSTGRVVCFIAVGSESE